MRRGSLCCNNNDSSQKHLEDWWWKFYKRESPTVTRCVHKARERKGFDRQEVNCPKFKSIQSPTIALDGTIATLNDLRSVQLHSVCICATFKNISHKLACFDKISKQALLGPRTRSKTNRDLECSGEIHMVRIKTTFFLSNSKIINWKIPCAPDKSETL